MRGDFVIVAGKEVVGPFRSSAAAEEWGDTYIGEQAKWYVANFTSATAYEREVQPPRRRR